MIQRALAFACVLFLVAAPSVWGETRTLFQGVEPGQEYDLDLATGRITANEQRVEPLPFDVHFYLRSKVADPVTTVESRIRGFKQPQDCDAVDYTKCQPGALCPDPQRAVPKGGAGAHAVELLISALEPNRYYCFQYVQAVTAAPVVRAAVVGAIDEVAKDPRSLDPVQFETLGGVDDLRRAMLQAAERVARERLGPTFVVRALPRDFFDTAVPLSRLDPEAHTRLTNFLNAQGSLNLARSALQQSARDGANALRDLNSSLPWRIVKTKLLDNAQEPRVEVLLGDGASALDLIDDSSVDLAARSEGHTTRLFDIWQSTEINHDPLRQQLRALERFAQNLRQDETLRAVAGLGEEALQEELASICGSILPDDAPLCIAKPATPLFFRILEAPVAAAKAKFSPNPSAQIEADAEVLRRQLRARSTELATLTDKLVILFFDVLRVRASTVADYETNAFWYVGADVGAALAWELEEGFTYVGANVYFRPVNKKARLTLDDWRRGHRWAALRQRLSLTVGLPRDDVKGDNFEPLIQEKPAVVGLGWRLNNFLRLTLAGALVFREQDPNPLVDSKRLAWSPIVGLSLDWNIASTMSKAFAGIFGSPAAPQAQSEPAEEEP